MSKCGVYAIQNKVNKRIYIGSSVDVEIRWRAHQAQLRKGKHTNTTLQKDWDNYGSDGFKWILLESVATRRGLSSCEQRWIDRYMSHCPDLIYNTAMIVRSVWPEPSPQSFDVLALRASLGWTQRELAEHLDVTTTAVSHWETGHRNPNRWIVEKLIELQEKSASAQGARRP